MFYPEDTPKELADGGVEESKDLDPGTGEHSDGAQGAGEQGEENLSSEGIDISKLPPEAQKLVKGFQASYTRKMQSLTESTKNADVKTEQTERLREQYEQKLFELTKPKGQEEPLVDTSQMTAEQEKSWNSLNKHFDKKIEQVRNEERKTFENRLNVIQRQVGDVTWRSFVRENPDASKYRPRMSELMKEKGGVNCPLNLDELLTLAQKDDLKKLGAEEYRQSVKQQKEKVTTKPSSSAGQETGIEFEKGLGRNPNRFMRNFQKAVDKGKEDARKLGASV